MQATISINTDTSITGASLTGDDWLHNIQECPRSGIGNNTQFCLEAGRGGVGITQTNAGVAKRATTLAYTRIEIKSGTVLGGTGGKLVMDTTSMPVLTHYGLMNHPIIDAYMQGVYSQTDTYDDYVSSEIKFMPGEGGDGVMIGAGRKCLTVETPATVSGGSCGSMDYGKSKWVNNVNNYDKWKKLSKKTKKKIGGIEIQVQGPNFEGLYAVSKKKTSKAIKVPKAKTKYKVRVRAYKGSGIGKQVSKWSGWKTVKVK